MKRVYIARAILLLLGIGLLVAGIVTGDFMNTFHKAIRICYECVGIG